MHRVARSLKSIRAKSHRFLTTTSNEKSERLDGRVAIVTAGTNGIGLSIAKRLARNGAHVVVSSRKQENVDKAVDEMKDMGLKVSGIACHFGEDDQREELLKKTMSDLGAINILVQNAGVNPHPFAIMKTPESVIDKTCDIHIKANFRIVQQIAPYMAQSEHQGSIILTSSIAAYAAHLYPGIYGISKSAVVTMTRSFMSDLLKQNIRINCLTMGAIDTNFIAEVKKDDFTRINYLSHTPMRRFGTPEECAGLAAYLASDDSSFITGENFCITGGLFTRV